MNKIFSSKLRIVNFLWLLLLIVVVKGTVAGATFTVTKTADTNDGICDADCSLREALGAANATATNDEIGFAPNVFGAAQTIVLGGNPLTVANNGSLKINGTGPGLLSISGNNLNRVIIIDIGATAIINAVTIRDGNGHNIGLGGGISNLGTLTLNNSIVRNNYGEPGGGGIYNQAVLSINDSSISNNTTNLSGGGIHNFNDQAILTITNSTISQNTGGRDGGGIYNNGAVTIISSTISGNTASSLNDGGSGGGISTTGYVNRNSSVTVTNSTIANNTARFGGGGISNDGSLINLNSVTINGNSTTYTTSGGGGISSSSGNYPATVNARNTIFADNTTASGNAPDFSGAVTSQGYNLIENTSGTSFTTPSTTDIVGKDPKLAPLANNGGPTQTCALLPGSPAVDVVPNNFPATDQRGYPRPADGDRNSSYLSDIGAFELQGNPPTAVRPSPPTMVTANTVSATQINVFWNPSPANESVTSYNLRINGSQVITDIPYLSYAVKGLTPNTTYTFEVQSGNSLGVSAWSAPAQATTQAIAPPAKVSPQPVSASQINVFWDASTSANVASYNLRINGSQVITGITYLSYAVKNLTANTTYTFEVQTVTAEGFTSAWSAPAQAATLAPVQVNPPARVNPQVVSGTQINVFWDASTSPNITSYNLRVNGANVITGITYLSYAVKNLNPGATYTFEVQAVDSSGAVSAFSAPVSATTSAVLPPTTVSPQAVSDSQINIFWNASTSPNIAYYNLRVNGSRLITQIPYLSYALKLLSGGTTYTFEVQAVDSSGAVSAFSAPVSATTNPPVVLVAPPTTVSTQVVSSSQINVFWNASTSQNIVSYAVRVNGLVTYINIPYLSYAVKNLTPNTTYTFEVASVNSAGTISAFSAPVSATTAPVSMPNAPTNVSPQTVSSSQINVFWNASTSPNVTSYNLRINGANVITGITYLSYAVKNLAPNTTYTFEVQAVDPNGVSNWSQPVSAATAAALTAPVIAAAQPASSSQINVFWNGPQNGENVTSYNLRVNGGTVITGITYLSYAVKNLNPNTTYTFEVQAVGPAGNSNWSQPVSATTAAAGNQAAAFSIVDFFNAFDYTEPGKLIVGQSGVKSNWNLFSRE